jgi:hypothetical protein
MAAEKVASVRLQLNNRGFLASVRSLEGGIGGVVKKILSRMSAVGSTIRGWVKDAASAGKALGKVARDIAKDPFGSMVSGLRKLESKSIATFRKIGAAAKKAFSASATRMPDGGSQGAGGGKGKGAKGKNQAKAAAGEWAHAKAIAVKDLMLSFASRGVGVVEDANRNAETAAQISTNARNAGGKYVDPKLLEAEAYAVTQEVKGTTAEGALDAMAKFLTLTGDLDTARASLSTFATVSRATGANMGAVAEATASISKQFGITDPTEIKDTLAALTYQGKAGAIELTDLAAGLQSVAAAGAAFGMQKGSGGVKKLGGLTQIARSGTGGAAQTFTAIENVFKSLLEKSDDFKKEKVNVFEGKGANKKTRSIDDVLIDAIAKVGGKDMEKKSGKLSELFGGEAMKAINPLMGIYKTAFTSTQGTDSQKQAAGIAALRKAFDESSNAAGDWSDVVSDAAQMQQTNSAKLTATFESLKAKVGDAVLPKLTELVDKLLSSSDAIDMFVLGLELMADMANDLAGFLKEMGIIKERKKTSFEYRDEAAQKATKLRAELQGMQMTPEQIKEMETSNPEELAKRREKAKDLQVKIAGEDAAFKHWNDFGNKGGFSWDMTDAPVVKSSTSKMKDKYATAAPVRVSYGYEMSGAAPATPAGAPAAPAAPAPGPLPKAGPLRIAGVDGTLKVHVVGDDTTRGGGAQPLPGRYPRP